MKQKTTESQNSDQNQQPGTAQFKMYRGNSFDRTKSIKVKDVIT